jgi:glycosyltransferase 2 family protein
LRAARWREIVGASHPIGFSQAYHPVAIGFMLNFVLPARAGEIARPLILQNKDGVPFTTGLATVAAERMFDLLCLIALFAWMLSTVRIDPAANMTFGSYHLNKEMLENIANGMLKLLMLLIIGIVIFIVPQARQQMIRVLTSIPNLFPESLKPKVGNICSILSGMVENIASGFILVRHPKRIYKCILYTLLVWGIQIISYYLVSLGCPGIGLSVVKIGAVMVMICFFVALPSVPGFWGVWEAGGVFALSLFGVSAKEAAGYTLVNHAVQIFPVILAGLISAVISGINVWQVSYKKE